MILYMKNLDTTQRFYSMIQFKRWNITCLLGIKISPGYPTNLKGLPQIYISKAFQISRVYRNSMVPFFFPGLGFNTYTKFQKKLSRVVLATTLSNYLLQKVTTGFNQQPLVAISNQSAIRNHYCNQQKLVAISNHLLQQVVAKQRV